MTDTRRTSSLDPVAFAGDLIRCPSITPRDKGALDVLQGALEAMGFVCKRYGFGDAALPEADENTRVDNLYARLGTRAPNFCFAGHTDVVPVGDDSGWDEPPFSGAVVDGFLRGRGAADMKGGIAAFVAAVSQLLSGGWRPAGSISLLITGDEEGPALHGTKALLEAITDEGEVIDHCLVGEPTNPTALGQQVKNGRRGSLNGYITATGTQGHVAYPHLADNPIPAMMRLIAALTARHLDDGNSGFQPSNLEITSIDVGNNTTNIIPAIARARFNIRFNTKHTGAQLSEWIEAETQKAAAGFEGTLETISKISGEAFLTQPSEFTDILQDATQAVVGKRPELSTAGGTSDARFIANYAPVAELGLIGATMHKVNERVAVSDIHALTKIYAEILKRYFA